MGSRMWVCGVCAACSAAGLATYFVASDRAGSGVEAALATGSTVTKTESLPTQRATGAADVLVGAQGTPVLRIRGLGQLNVSCVHGEPSAAWINRSLTTEIAGVNGSGVSPVLETLAPRRALRATLGPGPTTSVWQIGALSEASRATVTITLSTSRSDDRTCLSVVQATVTRGQRTGLPTA